MSTKIYNGIRFKSSNLDDIINSLVELRPKIKEEVIVKLIEEITIYKDLYDFNMTSQVSFSRQLSEALSKPNKRIEDINCDFKIFIYYYPKDKRYYGYYINPGYIDIKPFLFDNDLAEDFHYQNQCDKEDDISQEDWDYRIEVWDYCLPGIGLLQERGLLFNVVDNSFIHFDDKRAIYNTIVCNIAKAVTK